MEFNIKYGWAAGLNKVIDAIENGEIVAGGGEGREVLATDIGLSGISFGDSEPVIAADNVLTALGKLQAQVALIPEPTPPQTLPTAGTLTLTGVNVSLAGTVAASDSVLAAIGKLQRQASAVPAAPTATTLVLTGINLSQTGTVVAADSVLAAIGKLQRQITALPAPVTVPVGVGVDDADDTDIVTKFNALLSSLRSAGLIAPNL